MNRYHTRKAAWIRQYSSRIVGVWRRWEGPLGVDREYEQKVRDDLETWFDDPLKRELIEETYNCGIQDPVTQ